MRIHQQPAYLLHARPWSETSLLVDMFTREYGRFRLLAKGARRRKTGQRAILQSFQPLNISWSGKRSLMTLTGVEASHYYPRLNARNQASAYYMSELLFKFLHANDAHERLFESYAEALDALRGTQPAEAILRRFECHLLSEIGYGLQLECDVVNRSPIRAEARYHYHPEKGPAEALGTHHDDAVSVSGHTLLALASRRFETEQSQRESKRLLRSLLLRQVRSVRGSKGDDFSTRAVYAQMLTLKIQ